MVLVPSFVYRLIFLSLLLSIIMSNSKGLALLQKELEDLAISHDFPRQSKKHNNNSLQPRHVEEFNGNTLFDQFARAVCESNCVPRKELFETWATALHVHDFFPEDWRFADLACGHGLLSWALLLLNMERTAICIDRRMPKSADKIRNVMIQKWPNLDERWNFIEGKLESIEPAPSTLLVGVHCCGTLSDKVVDLSIKGNSPLVLVPCCHTFKGLAKETKKEIKDLCWNLTDYLDSKRIERLSDAGFEVDESQIPKVFTPKNRIILAKPSKEGNEISRRLGSSSLGQEEEEKVEDIPKEKKPPIEMPNNDSVSRIPGFAEFVIHLDDSPEAKQSIQSMSGREAANLRKGPARPLGLSLYVTTDTLTAEQVSELANSLRETIVVWVDTKDKEAKLHRNGKLCKTFRLVYRTKGEEILTKDMAKEVHVELCERIPETFQGVEVRQIPR